jgi:hypothetical protein
VLSWRDNRPPSREKIADTAAGTVKLTRVLSALRWPLLRSPRVAGFQMSTEEEQNQAFYYLIEATAKPVDWAYDVARICGSERQVLPVARNVQRRHQQHAITADGKPRRAEPAAHR